MHAASRARARAAARSRGPRELASTGEWTSRGWLQADDGGRIDATRAALADPRYDAAWAAGATLTVEQALDAARSVAAMAEPADGGELPHLTSRELDVLRLLTGDLSHAHTPRSSSSAGAPCMRTCARSTASSKSDPASPPRAGPGSTAWQARKPRSAPRIARLETRSVPAGRSAGRTRQRPLAHGEPRVDMSPAERPVFVAVSRRADSVRGSARHNDIQRSPPASRLGHLTRARVAYASPGRISATLPRLHATPLRGNIGTG